MQYRFKNKNFLFLRSSRGFSLIEILIALFVFSTAIASMFAVSFGNQTALMNVKIYQDLFSISQRNLENAKATARSDFASLVSYEEISEGFEKNLEVSLLYDYTKEVKSKVRKSNSDLRGVDLPLYASDWRGSLGADTCFRRLENMQDYEILQIFPLGIANPATDLDVVRGKAYITIDSIISPNFLVVEVSDVNNPEFISNSWSSGRRLVSLHVAGKYAYLATGSTVRQLQVLDIENPADPELLSEFRLPSPSGTTTQSSIFYKDGKIYLGSEKNNWGKEFHVIDVDDPASPEYLGGFRVDTKVNSIALQEDLAFIAVPNPAPLRALDISNYQNIQSVNSYEAGGLTQHGGQTLAITDNLLGLGRSVQGINPPQNYHEVFLFDISNNDLILKASKRLGLSIRDLILRDKALVLIGTLGNLNTVQFLSTEEESLLELEADIDLPEKPVALDCEDDKLYVLTSDSSVDNSLIIIGKDD